MWTKEVLWHEPMQMLKLQSVRKRYEPAFGGLFVEILAIFGAEIYVRPLGNLRLKSSSFCIFFLDMFGGMSYYIIVGVHNVLIRMQA